MRKFYIIMFMVMAVCLGCQWHATSSDGQEQSQAVVIDRFDRMESLYLTMGDFAALRQMRTDYPLQTRTLIEDVLQLGPVDDPDINNRLLMFFKDSTLQDIIADVGRQYDNLDDLNRLLTEAFRKLSQMQPGLVAPKVYTQIGSLDQSIVVADGLLGISLDKYLGADYPAYIQYGYTEHQRSMMTREYIVPDCLGFYLLRLYPMPDGNGVVNAQRHQHMMKIQCVVNEVMGRKVFSNESITRLEEYRKNNPRQTLAEFLQQGIAC